jgi:hypothetical protein
MISRPSSKPSGRAWPTATCIRLILLPARSAQTSTAPTRSGSSAGPAAWATVTAPPERERGRPAPAVVLPGGGGEEQLVGPGFLGAAELPGGAGEVADEHGAVGAGDPARLVGGGLAAWARTSRVVPAKVRWAFMARMVLSPLSGGTSAAGRSYRRISLRCPDPRGVGMQGGGNLLRPRLDRVGGISPLSLGPPFGVPRRPLKLAADQRLEPARPRIAEGHRAETAHCAELGLADSARSA